MTSYITNLEAQNEELKQRLAAAESELAIVNRRHTERLQYQYIVSYRVGEMISMEEISKLNVLGSLAHIKRDGIHKFLQDTYPTFTNIVFYNIWIRGYRHKRIVTADRLIFAYNAKDKP